MKENNSLIDMHNPDVKLPYVDYLLDKFRGGDEILIKSFGRHMHWGYWDEPGQALLSADDYALAAEKLSKLISKAGNVQQQQTILDVGCGFGGTIGYLNENFQDMKLVGINLDERQLDRANKMVVPVGNNLVEFMQGNACTLPFPDQTFDTVLAVECIFHFPSREEFFKEAWRVLKPGGYLSLSDFVIHPYLQPLAKIKLPDKISTGFFGKCNLQYRQQDYRKLAEKTGFIIQTEQDITTNTMPSYGYLRQLGKKYPINNIFAYVEVATAEMISRLRLLHYFIYSFQKL